MPAADFDPLDAVDLRARVTARLAEFLATQRDLLTEIAEDMQPVFAAAEDFLLDGGKRLRPAFCYWGFRGAGGPDGEPIVTVGAALELLHAGALMHDDVMDSSDTRRGQPSVHRRFARLHHDAGWVSDAVAFGQSAATLLGDLCLIWSDMLFAACGLPSATLPRSRSMFDRMRVEVMAGQYLDVVEQARGGGSIERALRVARLKSARYTVQRPVQLGGTLGGAAGDLLAAYAAYGEPLGEAFQLRDDVLGVFGDPAETGKPAGDDLREGKRTALVAAVMEAASPAAAALLTRSLGDPDLDAATIEVLRSVIRDSGALDRVESFITSRTAAAVAALDEAPFLDEDARTALRSLAEAATRRVG